MGADTLATEWIAPEVLLKYYPGGPCGVDKEGYPFWIDTLGYVDIRGMLVLSSHDNEVLCLTVYYVMS